jgi:hypothetical protein
MHELYAKGAVDIAAAEDCADTRPTRGRHCGRVLHLADHDPNGIDMMRDNAQRQGCVPRPASRSTSSMCRYAPPPNFAKEVDTRYA